MSQQASCKETHPWIDHRFKCVRITSGEMEGKIVLVTGAPCYADTGRPYLRAKVIGGRILSLPRDGDFEKVECPSGKSL